MVVTNRVFVVLAVGLGGCTFGSNGGGGGVLGGSTSGEDDTTAAADGIDDGGPGNGPGDTAADPTTGPGATDDTTTSPGTDTTPDTDGSTGDPPVTCGQDNGGCSLDATCAVQDETIVCTCNEGWMGDGITCESSGVLPTLRFEVACTGSTVDCPNASGFCTTSAMTTGDTMTMQGDPGVTYAVTIGLRGVLSEKTYIGGVADMLWYEGGTPAVDAWASVQLEVSDPPQSYYVNAGASGNAYCDRIEYDRTVSIATGATVTITYADENMCAALNEDGFGDPIAFTDVPPVGAAFDGQFLQVDMLSSVPM